MHTNLQNTPSLGPLTDADFDAKLAAHFPPVRYSVPRDRAQQSRQPEPQPQPMNDEQDAAESGWPMTRAESFKPWLFVLGVPAAVALFGFAFAAWR